MKPFTILTIIFSLVFGASFAQTTPDSDFKTTTINKPIKEFPNKFDLSTPLNAALTCTYITVDGKEGLWRAASTSQLKAYFQKQNAPDKIVNEKYKNILLNDTIREIIVYKDSVAGVIRGNGEGYYLIRMLRFEDNKWVNSGEDFGVELQSARERFRTLAIMDLNKSRKRAILDIVSTDTLAFINYAKQKSMSPKEFMLNTIAEHKLVIYGEVHMRKVSWDLLRSTLANPRFAKTVGTVFMELPSNQQTEMDKFYASKTLNKEILLNILRAEQVYGWWDRGEYEFLIDIWALNQSLPKNKRIKVVLTDAQLPYQVLKTPEEYKQYRETMPNRNNNMADIVENTIKSKTDKRNSLFIVGWGHTYKSDVPGDASSYQRGQIALTAGAQLAKRLPKGDVFTIFQHCPIGDNSGKLFGKIRQGLFDTVFEKLGNQPLAFNLHNSPFGKEPLDADPDLAYDMRTGSFENNFDGYIFLQPLKDENTQYILYDIWSDKFVEEMKRRAALMNESVEDWFPIKEINKEEIIRYFKEKYEGRKRWSGLDEI